MFSLLEQLRPELKLSQFSPLAGLIKTSLRNLWKLPFLSASSGASVAVWILTLYSHNEDIIRCIKLGWIWRHCRLLGEKFMGRHCEHAKLRLHSNWEREREIHFQKTPHWQRLSAGADLSQCHLLIGSKHPFNLRQWGGTKEPQWSEHLTPCGFPSEPLVFPVFSSCV